MSARERFLDEAIAIGDRLCERALVAGRNATWLSATPPNPDPKAPPGPRIVSTVDATLYSGLAGIGLFLTRLSAFSDARRHRQVAASALATAARIALVPEASGRAAQEGRLGFYGGAVGTAFALHEAGVTLGRAELARSVGPLLQRLWDGRAAPHDLDVVGGNAGSLGPLKVVAAEAFPQAEGLARFLADRLVRAQVKEDSVAAWPSPLQRTAGPALCGLSHGAAGMAWALAHWHQREGGAAFADAALGAWRYESRWYDADRANWPRHDLEPLGDGTPQFTLAWCHGSPGAALARATLPPRAQSSERRQEAREAVRVAESHLRNLGRVPGLDVSPCHGLLGIAESVWMTKESLDGDGQAGAEEVGDWGLARYGADARRRWGGTVNWPTVLAYDEHPSFMNGLAGIGHYFLRLHEPRRVPSLLIPPWPA